MSKPNAEDSVSMASQIELFESWCREPDFEHAWGICGGRVEMLLDFDSSSGFSLFFRFGGFCGFCGFDGFFGRRGMIVVEVWVV